MWEKELVDILEEERKLLELILERECEKREKLLSRSIESLPDINLQEDEIFKELDRYEFIRNELTKRISKKLNLDGEVNLSRIIEFASNRDHLIALRDRIISIISNIREVSFENRILIESSMSVSMAVLEKMISCKTFQENYNSRGQKEITSVDINTYSTIL
ncbi:MAG: flagellar export chaperone FlgN [Brevinematales bacterium]|nr:flagellar export chaperone FlgN [Brevinematales bacterium]